MMKRVIALLLCLVTVLFCFAGCSHGEEDKGAYIRMYLTEKVMDFDPLHAFDNESSLQLVSLLFEGLFTADENGKPKKALADSYKFIKDKDKNEYRLSITLKTTKWSDGVALSSTDVQYAFLRLFDTTSSTIATTLLRDVKNARKIMAGDETVDHLGITVVDQTTIEILFEHEVDEDAFLLNLCSPALYPLRADIVEGNPNWAKKPGTLICSGPFMLRFLDPNVADGLILERNSYYMRNRSKDDLDKYVEPYRIIVNYAVDGTEQLKNLASKEAGGVYYFGHIPLAARADGAYSDILKKVKVTDAPSTHVYYLNEKALIDGEALFAKKEVRQALSLALDREAMANAIVYAQAADGLVPHTILNRTDKKTEFRKKAASYLATTANVAEAKNLLQSAGVTASKYTFTIKVAAYDEDHVKMAELTKAAWESLGFTVNVEKLGYYEIINTYIDPSSEKEIIEKTGMYESALRDALRAGDFEVIALDLVATAPDAFSYLSPFAKAFSGNPVNMDTTVNPNYELSPHITGYDSEAYNAKIEEAYAATKAKDVAARLHEAEGILMEDLPVIPVVYNQNAALTGKGLSGVKSSFFCNATFSKAKLSGYWKIALAEGFVGNEEEEE